MTEENQVSFLVKAAASFVHSEENPTQNLLKSYYLMRCRELAKDGGLPDKYFSSKVRCTHCFIEWKKTTETKVRPVKLSKRQKKRIKQYKTTKSNKEDVKNRKDLLKSNELEQICSFCKHPTITLLQKPSKPKLNDTPSSKAYETAKIEVQIDKKKTSKPAKQNAVKQTDMNVYAKAKDVFSLSNKNNNLQGIVKQEKNIKNNKKKKDKFAGLCQQAVIASAKLKQEKEDTSKKRNKLNLFLKPSS